MSRVEAPRDVVQGDSARSSGVEPSVPTVAQDVLGSVRVVLATGATACAVIAVLAYAGLVPGLLGWLGSAVGAGMLLVILRG